MCWGIPVIGVRSGASPELIKHNETGYLSEINDIQDMGFNIETLINHIELYKTFSQNSQRRVRSFSIEKTNKSIKSNYDNVIKTIFKSVYNHPDEN